jgi:hypothetical protein
MPARGEECPGDVILGPHEGDVQGISSDPEARLGETWGALIEGGVAPGMAPPKDGHEPIGDQEVDDQEGRGDDNDPSEDGLIRHAASRPDEPADGTPSVVNSIGST